MQPLSREQLNRNRYLRATSFEGKADAGDTFRRARGDDLLSTRNSIMADDDSAGETITSVLLPTGHAPSTTTTTTEPDTIDDISSSRASSPPTHPAFFSPSPGKKTRCLEASSFSPATSPLAKLVAGVQQKAGAAMLIRLSLGVEGGDGAVGAARERKMVSGDVDTNIVATLPNETDQKDGDVAIDNAPKDGPSKKNKRKSKKNAAMNGNKDEHLVPEPASYAEAIKEDPKVVEKRAVQQVDGADEKLPEPTSYAEAVKEDPAVAEKRDSQQSAGTVQEDPTDTESEPSDGLSRAKEGGDNEDADQSVSKSPVTPAFSQASTSMDYPDLRDGGDEDDGRRRDKRAATEVMGLRWAPLRVPFKRRLQTLAVLAHCLAMALALATFFGLCAVPFFWPIIIIYVITTLFSTDSVNGDLKKRKEWFRRLPVWKYFVGYFPMKLHKTHPLQSTRKYIFGYHPHGIISHGAWGAFATEALGFSEKFPGITNSLLTLDSNFILPLYREYVFSMGLASVSKKSIVNILSRGGRNGEGMGRAVTIVVGGAREALDAHPNVLRLIVRKGFIKVALQSGADLVPVVAFGENDLYDQLDPHTHPSLHKMQRMFLRTVKWTVPLLHGRGIFNYDVGLMPYRRPVNIVVGKPIPVMQVDNPDNEAINKLHQLYVEELQKIWDRYKDDFAKNRKEELQFLD